MVTSPVPKKLSLQGGQKQKLYLETIDNVIRIPLSGILIKFLSLPAIAYAKAKQAGLCPLRLCGEKAFGQECFFTINLSLRKGICRI
jgi:hypothetical protein